MSTQQQIVRADAVLPNKLVIFPLQHRPMFPGIYMPMMISEGPALEVMEAALETGGFVGLILSRSEEDEPEEPSDLHEVGTACRIVRKINLPDGGLNVFVSTLKRFRIVKVLDRGQPMTAAVEYLEDSNFESDEVRALTRALLSEMKQVSEDNPLMSEEMRLNMVNIDHPGKIADFVSSILNVERAAQQDILETIDVQLRLEKVLVFIKKEQELIKIQKRIQEELNNKIQKSQREYFLKEQLKAIQEELGMTVDSKTEEHQRLSKRFSELALEGEVAERVADELEKFRLMDPSSAEFVVTRNYLESIAALPWEDTEQDPIDLGEAERILDEDHYGLDDVKERILEYLAVRSLRHDNQGSIVCLIGPPGVGKTSIGKSIARATGRGFFRFSVGGMRDEAEIKGHRRTYVGAMPGKIIQGLRIVKSKTPVFMIDEIDKLGASYQGDPSSALLEVLDPEQNVSFRDHYLDLPFDISQILFIATANNEETIPAPLLDRMEVIRLSGYIDAEKVEIARTYLIPKSAERAGLKRSHVRYTKRGLRQIANGYAREAGVRNFEKALNRIHRKIAREAVLGKIEFPVKIDDAQLEAYLGKPVFTEEADRITGPGMVTGLAWTALGGAVLTVEAAATRGDPGITLTGQMGEVMQESAAIALTYAKTRLARVDAAAASGSDRRTTANDETPNNGRQRGFFDTHRVHLHIPAGATKKDGPSAGVTMASCLLSLALGKRIRQGIAMTGELSLTGNVLPIGGLKEKVIAAKRNGIKQVFFPKQNEKDLDEIPDHVARGITFVAVSRMDEIVEQIL